MVDPEIGVNPVALHDAGIEFVRETLSKGDLSPRRSLPSISRPGSYGHFCQARWLIRR